MQSSYFRQEESLSKIETGSVNVIDKDKARNAIEIMLDLPPILTGQANSYMSPEALRVE